MCQIAQERIRIIQILLKVVTKHIFDSNQSLEDLTNICFLALQIHYDGLCDEECLFEKAKSFAVWSLAGLNGRRVGLPLAA
jgi:hypothetical protein